MFGKVKHWLGIEGVKLDLIIPEDLSISSEILEGYLEFTSMHTQVIRSIKIRIIEKYTRGRGKDKKINDYELGEIHMEKDIKIPANEKISINFSLPFVFTKSDMDELQEKNVIVGSVVRLAKWTSNISSTFYVEVTADVKGTALDPFDKKEINLI